MKIVYLHQYFNTPDMAGGTRSYEMAKRLVSWGHEVHIVTTWRIPTKKTDWYEEMIDGIHVHWLPISYNNSMTFLSRVRAFLRFALKSARKAAKIGGDVILATSTPLTIAIPGIYASKAIKKPMVFEVRDLWPDIPITLGVIRNPVLKKLAIWLEKLAYSSSERVIALSQGMAEGVVRAGFPKNCIDVIPNSSDIDLFEHCEEGARRFRQNHPEIGDGPIVLYPGTFGRVNGVSYLVKLANSTREIAEHVNFVVIGDGAEFDSVKSLAAELGVLGLNFFQYDSMSKRDLVDAFSAASVIASVVIDEPVLWANSANKFFDALASGTPIAINYQGWQAELLETSKVGLVLPLDLEEAAPKLVGFLNSSSNLVEAGIRARRLAKEKFSREDLALKLEHVLKSAIQTYGEKF
jgi:glycosyltransferase involved in cell wall biosynthesis